ncbi:unnamed protein product, partial [Acidithrix sp. C25]
VKEFKITDDLLEIGRIHRPHGIKGEVSVSFVSNRKERRQVGARLFVGGQWLIVASSKVHHDRILIGFEGYSDRNRAELLSGMMIYGEPIEDDEALWIHKLIGSSVLDQDGIDRGVVIEVIENPASDLLSLASGALVPLVFVSRFDAASSKIYIEAPEGLFVDYPSSSEPQG